MLLCLPPELLDAVYAFLPRSSLHQLALTSRALYEATLPILYRHIVFTFRTHIRQLEASLQRKNNSLLVYVVSACTTTVTLQSKQAGHHHLIVDALALLRHHLPRLVTLTLTDFHMLSTSTLVPLLSTLPRLDRLVFRYCNLVAQPSNVTVSFFRSPAVAAAALTRPSAARNADGDNDNATAVHCKALPTTKLEMHWTNFSKAALDTLLQVMPSLDAVALHANHNRHYLANDQALASLTRYCPRITDLAIGLQEIKDETFANCIAFYGPRLLRLNLRTHPPWNTLLAIAKHARQLHDLTLRFPVNAKWYSSAISPAIFARPATAVPVTSSPWNIAPIIAQQQQQQQQRQRQVNMDLDEEEEEEHGGLLDILLACEQLTRIQVISMDQDQASYVQAVPPLICKAISTVTLQRSTRRPDSRNCPSSHDHPHQCLPVQRQARRTLSSLTACNSLLPATASASTSTSSSTATAPSSAPVATTTNATTAISISNATLLSQAYKYLKLPSTTKDLEMLLAQSPAFMSKQPIQQASTPCVENSLTLDDLHLYHIRALLSCFI
ncbi:hypothetical protein BC940DRAFT_287558 [Gongronella butleri]|nr:hypothetical protein BC940DRAFT_287558 [Gongronella butleri]